MPRLSKKRKFFGVWFLAAVFLLATSSFSSADDSEASADAVEARAVRRSSTGNTFLFQTTAPAISLRADQIIHVRRGTKKVMAAKVLRKQGNSVYLKRVQGGEGEGDVQDGEIYTLVFGIRRPEAVPGSGDRDSYSVEDQVEGLKILLEPSGGYGIGKLDFGSADLGSFGTFSTTSATSSMGGGLRVGVGKRRYFGAIDFRYGMTQLKIAPELKFTSILFGIVAGGTVLEKMRLYFGIDFINRLTVEGAGYTGSGARFGVGYLLASQVAITAEANFRSYSNAVANGLAVSLADLANKGYTTPDRIPHNEYTLSLSFPFML